MFYKCTLYKFEDDGRKSVANVPLRFEDTSLDDVFTQCNQHRRKGWEFADIWGFDGRDWRYMGVFFLSGGLCNG